MEVLGTLSLVLSILMLAFIVIGALYGLIVGFKKGLISGIYNLVLVVLLIIITSSITTLVLQMDLSSFGLSANGVTCNTLGDYLCELIQSNPEISNAITSHPELKDVILTLPSLIASPFIFVVLFWAIKLIVFIISLPINLIIHLCTKGKKKQVDARGKEIKPKKRRLLGMACGIVIGLIAVFATMIPIYGLGSALIKLDEIKMTDSGSSIVLYAEGEDDDSGEENESKSLLESLVGKDTSEIIISAYKGNVAINVTRIIGFEAIGGRAFNSLTRTKINGTEVRLLDDITNLANVYANYVDIYNLLSKETLTQTEMTDVLTKTDDTINKVFNVKFLTAVGNTVFPIVVDSILNDPDFPIQIPDDIKKDEIKNYIVEQALITLQEYDFTFVKDVLLSITDILKTTNDNGILTPVYNSIKTETSLTTKDYVNLIKNTNTTFAHDISTKLCNIQFIKDMSPTFVDSLFTGVFKAIDSPYSSNDITKEKASSFISNAIENAIETVKTLELESSLYCTKNSFSYIGKILDSIKDPEVLTNVQYQDLVEFVQTKATNFTSSLPVDLTGVINNISSVTNWTDELEKISETFDDLSDFYDKIKLEGVDINTLDLTTLGRMFNKLELTTLFGDEIRPIYNDMLETSKSSLTDYSSALEILKITDADLTEANQTKVDWENELTAISPLIKEILKFKDTPLPESDTEKAKVLISLCNKFDDVEQNQNSKIYGKKMQPLLTEVFTISKNLDAENSELYDDVIYRLNNRKPNETLTNCVEKGAITYAINTALDSISTEHGIKDALTKAKDFIIENNTLDKLLDSLETINSEIDSLKNLDCSDITNITDETIDSLANSLNKIKNTGSFPVSFTNEIMSNVLGEIDLTSISDPSTKTNMENYISEKQTELSNNTATVTDTYYKDILVGLKDLLPSV